jgi:L,D-peptidoglycan transpeptidase YkuD (ErfK/YbiS/YcfS/YnhG family)
MSEITVDHALMEQFPEAGHVSTSGCFMISLALRMVVAAHCIMAVFGCSAVRQTRLDDVPVLETGRLSAAAAPDSGQLLLVVPVRPDSSRAYLYAFDRKDGAWTPFAGPLKVMLGRNGFAQPGKKREGDGHNPTGLFPLEFAFGYEAAVNTKMPYRQATENDIWVDDVKSPDYNKWVKCAQKSDLKISYESMRLPDHRYRYGLVIGYNRNPAVAGLGSAIFTHVWLEEGKTTAGCVALDEANLVTLLAWLDPTKKPAIIMGDPCELASLPGLAGLAAAYHPPALTDHEQMVLSKAVETTERLVEYSTIGGFAGIATAVPHRVEDGMLRSGSWHQGCPVPVKDLAYLVLTYWGFDSQTHVGELVVHKKLALPVIKAFAELYELKFPMERMELIDVFNGSDDKSMAANNTSSFNCRDVTGKPGIFSKHSYGGAIDINPLQNPYLFVKTQELKTRGWNGSGEMIDFIRTLGYGGAAPVTAFCRANTGDCQVLPPESASYLDRSVQRSGMLLQGESALKAFTDRDFTWGGLWPNTAHPNTVDYQHVEYDVNKL